MRDSVFSKRPPGGRFPTTRLRRLGPGTEKDRWQAVRLYEIFGSEELSVIAPAVAKRVPAAYIALGPEDAAALQTGEGEVLHGRPGRPDPGAARPPAPPGCRSKRWGLPWGVPGMPYWDEETRITVSKDGRHE